MNSGRLLQRLDNMSQEPHFDFASIGQAAAVRNVEVSDDSLVALIDKERIAENASAVDRRISWQNFRVNVAENHLRGARIVPREQALPKLGLVLQQRTQINGRKVPEVEYFQKAPA